MHMAMSDAPDYLSLFEQRNAVYYGCAPTIMISANQLLCVGNDPVLLETRCAVLTSDGYRAEFLVPKTAEDRLKTHVFKIVILSMSLTESERKRILALLPTDTKTLIIEQFIDPRTLLDSVRRLLPLQ